jgi:hypothetical protein
MLPFGSPFANNAFATGLLGGQPTPLPGSMPSNAGMFPPIPQLHLPGMNASGMPQMQPSAIQGLAPITYGDSLQSMMPYMGPSYGALPQTQMGYGGMPLQFGMPMQQNPMLTNPLAYMQQPGQPTFGGFNPFSPPPIGGMSNASAITRQGAINSNPFNYNTSVPGAGAPAAAQPAATAATGGGGDQGASLNVTGGAEGGGVGGGASEAGGGQAEMAGGGSNDLGGMY